MIIFLCFVAIVVIAIIGSAFFTVAQQSAAIIERFGKFVRTALPGLHFKIPLVDQIAGRVNMRVQQLSMPVETKTQDNVFVKVAVSVQYHILEDKIYEAFYKLQNPEEQIKSFVFDVVRARAPKMILDDLFEKKDEIADAVKSELSVIMTSLGYGILKSLVTDIDPDEKVKAAMNEINEAQRLRVAANERGEAEKILKIKKAEAEAQSYALQGQGIANQRTAILTGLQKCIAEFQEGISGATASEAMNLVILTQYFDTMKEIGSTSRSNAIFLSHSPSAIGDLTSQLRETIISANQVQVTKDAENTANSA